MADKSKYGSSVAFTDLLFNIVVGLAFLFLLAFILMNPIAKEKDIEEKSDFIIVMTWDDESGDDIDLWVRDPSLPSTSTYLVTGPNNNFISIS